MQYVHLSSSIAPFLLERQRLLSLLLDQLTTYADSTGLAEVRTVAILLAERAVLRVPWGNGHQIGYSTLDGVDLADPTSSIFVTLVKQIDTWRLLPDDVATQFAVPSQLAQMQGAYYKSTGSIYIAM